MKKILLLMLFVAMSMYAETAEIRIVRDNDKVIGSLDQSIVISLAMQGIVVSTDNMHIAYIVRSQGRPHIYRDNKNDTSYDDIKTDSLVFSPNGNHFAYIASQYGKWMVVLDGAPQGQYDDIKSNSLTFSPDSKRLAYVAKGFNGLCVVVDGTPGKTYTFIKEDAISFSSDSIHVAYIAGLYNQYFIVLDEQKGSDYNMFVNKVGIVWDSTTMFHYFAVSNNRDIYIVTEKIEKK
ncbi:MAG: hypothetical protein PHE88_03520 [Elusimicrobia bacterium]|nr:hypothetical protein [Elusimicrobiota bacterium]